MLIRLGLSNRLRRILKVLFQFSLGIFLRKKIINSEFKRKIGLCEFKFFKYILIEVISYLPFFYNSAEY